MEIYLSQLFLFLNLIPLTILAYLPMRNQLCTTPRKIILFWAAILAGIIPICAAITSFTTITPNAILMLLFIIGFISYHKTLKVDLSLSISIFVFALSLMAFPSNISLAIDGWLHPTGSLEAYYILSTASQFIISCLFLLILSHISFKFGSRLVDSLSDSRVWLMILPIPVLFLFLNFLIQPRNYAVLHTENVFRFYVGYLIISTLMYLFIYIIFYFVVIELQESAKNKERIRFFEMQESQYQAQQHYLKETSRLRHDFRQSLYTLQELINHREFEDLAKYLKAYTDNLPINEHIIYCTSSSVNALLNYYRQQFESQHIRMVWEISLPEAEALSDIDLCGLLGNILENVYFACLSIPAEQRYHKFSITVHHRHNLFIVSANSFDGRVHKKNHTYLSIRRKGRGVGLSSIAMTAKKYYGVAQFSHQEHEFIIDVLMQIPTV